MEQLAVADGDLTAVRDGSGRDLVILHSLLTDRHAFDPVGFRAACMALVEADLVADLPALAVPTLVICGELDQATPPELNRLIATKVAGARYTELPRSGHCPPLEQPDAFLAAIGEFLDAAA